MAEPFRCPDCGKDMTDFVHHEAHYADDAQVGSVANWPWTTLAPTHALGSVCPWTRDYLSAEWLRRYPQPWSYT